MCSKHDARRITLNETWTFDFCIGIIITLTSQQWIRYAWPPILKIAHQARSSNTPQVKIKNCSKGKLCGIGGIYLQNRYSCVPKGAGVLAPRVPTHPPRQTHGAAQTGRLQISYVRQMFWPHWGPNIHLTGNLKTPYNKTHSGQTRRAGPTPYRLLTT